MRRLYGFTLIELVITLVLVGIVIAVVAPLAAQPFRAYIATQNRSQLVSQADADFFLLLRDAHAALPNSLRVNAAGTAVEMLHVQNAGRYRTVPSSLGGSQILDFSTAVSSFQVDGPLAQAPAGTQLVIYNTGQPGADAYAGDPVITPVSTVVTATASSPESLLSLSVPHQFPFPSPMQRFYLVDTPITYACLNGQLWRYDQYPIQSVVASPPAGARASLVGTQLLSCQFSYIAGTSSRAGLLSVQLQLNANNESLTLMEQANVPNGI